MSVIYTVGYMRVPLEGIRDLAESKDAVVIDVRLVAQSRKPQFNRGRLLAYFGEGRYKWVRDFGNVNYKNGGDIMLQDFEAGLETVRPIFDADQPVILLCACANLAVCHRKIVAERLSIAVEARVQHIHSIATGQQNLFGGPFNG